MRADRFLSIGVVATTILCACVEINQVRVDGPKPGASMWGARAAPMLGVSVQLGPGFDEEDRVECDRALQEHEGRRGVDAPVAVQIESRRDGNSYLVRDRGTLVRDEAAKGGGPRRLCREALLLGTITELQLRGQKPQFSIVMASKANDRQRQECMRSLGDVGLSQSNTPMFIAHIEFDTSEKDEQRNHLRITNLDGSLVIEGDRPDWGVGALCQDAAIQTLRAQIQLIQHGDEKHS